uniref:Uncharacterized protein n=1 Tax=Panagrolaimus sp. ES5 TaxID=591445 RepID=A0AC34FIU6_9BILA
MNYNLKPYKYIYGSTLLGSNDNFYGLIKINVETREVKTWSLKTWSRNHQLQIAAEPVFVPHPTGTDEDDGVVLAPVVNFKENDAPFVVVLDAKTFTEIARCKIGQRLPLEGDDLIKGKAFARGCKAVLKGTNEIWLEQENLSDVGFEFPRYNMNYNLKPYKYIYGSTLL